VSEQQPQRIKDIRVYRDAFIGMSGLACIPFLVFGAFAVYGGWISTAMMAVWVVLLFLGTRWFMPHPRWVLGLAVVGFVMWGGAVLLNH
jgi:hypothetical protein